MILHAMKRAVKAGCFLNIVECKDKMSIYNLK